MDALACRWRPPSLQGLEEGGAGGANRPWRGHVTCVHFLTLGLQHLCYSSSFMDEKTEACELRWLGRGNACGAEHRGSPLNNFAKHPVFRGCTGEECWTQGLKVQQLTFMETSMPLAWVTSNL